jgi:hypothetical protein
MKERKKVYPEISNSEETIKPFIKDSIINIQLFKK